MKKNFFRLVLILIPLGIYSNPHAGPEIVSRAAVLIDAATGTLLYSKNPDMEIPPASMTKLMTMHLGFMEVYAGRASMDEIIEPGRESWSRNQLPNSSVMHLAPGQQLSLRELFLGLAVFSGNDAAAAVALRFAPTVDAFVQMMNREALALGLSRTRFADPSGYSELSMTTPWEFAEFCRIYLETHPQSLGEFHSLREFSYPQPHNVAAPFRVNPETRVQQNRNTLLGRVEGVDGLKTGSIPAAGFNIALTAERAGTRFIAVVMGAPQGPGGDRIRDADGERLLNWAFENYRTIRLYPPNPQPLRIWRGRENHVELVWGDSLAFTALAARGENMIGELWLNHTLEAPLPAGSLGGTLIVYDSLGELRRIPLLTARSIEAGGLFKRFFDSIRLFFMK